MTYGTTLDFNNLFEDHQLAESVATVLVSVPDDGIPRSLRVRYLEHHSTFQSLFKIQPQNPTDTHRHPSSLRNPQTPLQPCTILPPAIALLRKKHPKYSQDPHAHPPPLPSPSATTYLPNQLPPEPRPRNRQQATLSQLRPKM